MAKGQKLKSGSKGKSPKKKNGQSILEMFQKQRDVNSCAKEKEQQKNVPAHLNLEVKDETAERDTGHTSTYFRNKSGSSSDQSKLSLKNRKLFFTNKDKGTLSSNIKADENTSENGDNNKQFLTLSTSKRKFCESNEAELHKKQCSEKSVCLEIDDKALKLSNKENSISKENSCVQMGDYVPVVHSISSVELKAQELNQKECIISCQSDSAKETESAILLNVKESHGHDGDFTSDTSANDKEYKGANNGSCTRDNKSGASTSGGNENEANDGKENKAEEDPNEYQIPYYLENFMFILNSVIKDSFYDYLFDEKDHLLISTFQKLSEEAQKVYIRLFGRQFRWIRKNKIVYPKIAQDLTEPLEELCTCGLLQNESSLNNLEEVLRTLPAPDLKTVAKSLRLSLNILRQDLISAVIKHTTQSNIGSFFKSKEGKGQMSGIQKSVLQRAKMLLGSCYKLCRDGRLVFMRVMLLFGLHNMQGEDDEKGGGQQQLFQMLMSNIGKVKYPEYTVCRQTKIFQNKEGLHRFSSALQTEVEISEALEKKDFDLALEVYQGAKVKLNEIMTDPLLVGHDRSLPPFLQIYTAGSVYTRVLSYGVELFQFTKKYNQAVEQLHELINQDLYHKDYRGRWYERLTLNLDHHLKKPSEALDLIKKGLNDPNIRKGHRYALFQRAQKICNASANKKLKKRWQEFSEDVMVCVQESPKGTYKSALLKRWNQRKVDSIDVVVFIKGRQLQNVVPGGYSMFISEESLSGGSNEVTFLKRVEDVALNHYKEAGYSEGLHAEGAIFSFLMKLYMWDIVFTNDVPDVFYNMYQTMPLDLYTLDFYEHRRELIDECLKTIQNASEEELLYQLEQAWEKHKDTMCVGVNWETFKDIDHAKSLVSCMGGSKLSAILDRMTKDLRFTRSGIPDLTLWDPDTKKFKIVEVKGPGDRLSTKQILWIDYLLCIGVETEVCYVQAVGAKKLH